ncbi:unnamed protein product [Orchesella dallaii]|uniref:Uncharacterized protein n=1 Tax=Orchesella dallaii TaxID=48710 RepID=A0ABP1PJR2_9HEXA
MDSNNNNLNPNASAGRPLDRERNANPHNINIEEPPQLRPVQPPMRQVPRDVSFPILYNSDRHREEYYDGMYHQPVTNMSVGRTSTRRSAYPVAYPTHESNREIQYIEPPSNLSLLSNSASRRDPLYDPPRYGGSCYTAGGSNVCSIPYNHYCLANNNCGTGRLDCVLQPPMSLGNVNLNSNAQQSSYANFEHQPRQGQGMDFSSGSSTIPNRGANPPAFIEPRANAGRGLMDSAAALLALGRAEPREPSQRPSYLSQFQLSVLPEDFRRSATRAQAQRDSYEALNRVMEEVVCSDDDDEDNGGIPMPIGNNPVVLPAPPPAEREQEDLEQVENNNDNGNEGGNEQQERSGNGGDNDEGGAGKMKQRIKVQISQKLKKGQDGTIEGQDLEITVSSIENMDARNIAQIVQNGIMQYLSFKGNAPKNSSMSSGTDGAGTTERKRSRAQGWVPREERSEGRRAPTSTATSSGIQVTSSGETKSVPRPPGLGQNMLSSGNVPVRVDSTSVPVAVERILRRFPPTLNQSTSTTNLGFHPTMPEPPTKRKVENERSNTESARTEIPNVRGEEGNKKKRSNCPSGSCSATAGSNDRGAERGEVTNPRNTLGQSTMTRARAIQGGESTDEDVEVVDIEGPGGAKKRQDKDKDKNKK